MTDFFTSCEDAVIGMLKNDLANHSSYFGSDPVVLAKVVNKSDESKLDEGYDYYAITFPGSFPSGFDSVSAVAVAWEIFIDIFVRIKNDYPQAWANFKAYRSDIFNLFNISKLGRTLNNTNFVKSGSPILDSEDEPNYYNLRANPDIPVFISQRCRLTVGQLINRT